VMAAQGFLVQGDSGLSGMVRFEGRRRWEFPASGRFRHRAPWIWRWWAV